MVKRLSTDDRSPEAAPVLKMVKETGAARSGCAAQKPDRIRLNAADTEFVPQTTAGGTRLIEARDGCTIEAVSRRKRSVGEPVARKSSGETISRLPPEFGFPPKKPPAPSVSENQTRRMPMARVDRSQSKLEPQPIGVELANREARRQHYRLNPAAYAAPRVRSAAAPARWVSYPRLSVANLEPRKILAFRA